jgi:hypothetical protein
VAPFAADRDLDGHQALSNARRSRQSPLRAFLLGVLVVVVLIAGWRWFVRRDTAPAERESAAPSLEEHAAPAAEPTPAAAPRPADRAAPLPPPVTDAGAAATAPTNNDAGEDALRPSHPITSAHVRIQRENNLLGALDGAMDVKDGAGMRRLLQQYRNEFPEDANQMQDGYRIIADCLEYPGPVSAAAGQRYYDRERGSTLRRFVARHCLGEP